MKTKVLSLSFSLLVSMNCMWAADEDVTPAHLNFAAQEVGPYEFVQSSNWGSNPDPAPAAADAAGTVILTGGQVSKTPDANVDGFNKGCHIVSSDYGNMLLIKGNGSTEAPELEAADALGGWLEIHMYTESDFPTQTPVRFQFVSKVIGGVTTGSAFKVAVYNFGGSTENSPLPPQNAYVDMDTKWWPVIQDLNVSTVLGPDQIPLRIKYSIPANHLNGRAIYIASIKFTANPSTECPTFDPINFDGWDTPTGNNTSTVVDAVNAPKGFVAWDRQNIYLNEMELGSTVYIYSITGSLVKTIQVNDSFMEVPMNQGVYVVKYGDKTSKVVL